MVILIASLLTLGVCAFALTFGGRSEKQAAVLVVAALSLASLLQAFVMPHKQLPVALVEVGLAAGFTVLAFLHRKRWLGALALICSAQVAAHVARFELSPSPFLMVVVNGLNVLALGVLFGATLATAHARRSQTSD